MNLAGYSAKQCSYGGLRTAANRELAKLVDAARAAADAAHAATPEGQREAEEFAVVLRDRIARWQAALDAATAAGVGTVVLDGRVVSLERAERGIAAQQGHLARAS